MHMLKYTHTHSIEGGGRGSLLDQPHPSSSPYNTPPGYSEFSSSQGESYPFHGAGQTSSGGYGSQVWGSQGSGSERDGIHHIITIKGLPATRGGVMVLEVEVKVYGGQVTSGQVRIISELLVEVKVVCIKVVRCVCII